MDDSLCHESAMMPMGAARQSTGLRGHWLRVLVFAIGLASGGVVTAADELDTSKPSLTLHGYGTLGYTSVHTDQPWLLKRDLAQSTSTPHGYGFIPDSNLGLQLNLQLNERASLVTQVVLRRRAPTSRAEENLEWAFGSYQIQPDLRLRVGRLNPDIFLLSNHRNVGFAYPWVRPNVEFYGWMPLSATDGLDITKSWRNGDVRWEANGLLGLSNRVTVQSGSGFADSKSRGKNGLSATLSREEGGLTLKLSYLYTKGKLDVDPQLQALLNGLNQLTALPLPSSVAQEAAALAATIPFDTFTSQYLSAGLRWEGGPWSVQAEIAHTTRKNPGAAQSVTGTFGYVSAGYRVGTVTFTGMLGSARSPKAAAADPQWFNTLIAAGMDPTQAAQTQAIGSLATAGANSLRIDQSSVSTGLRWDITPQTALKLQWDRVFVRANGSGLWANSTTPSGRADVYSASFNFVF